MTLLAHPAQSTSLHSQATQKTHAKLASFWNCLASAARTSQSCGARQAGSCSEGGKQPQGGPVLQQLLGLGRTPSEAEVFEILSAELKNWREDPRHATVILSSLARLRLPLIATNVLAWMLARSVPANVLHYNAVISAYGKGGQWQLALGLLGSMPNISTVPSKVSYNAAISACSKGGSGSLR
ncbi:unnamed protein product [Polarella glacialis]|uniref:Pentatricopeptide repeat-containing protein n=1 Tax=Polarella glacialis TaxID=89957 RepID=A0A813IRZ7_POLGL|nr:unnamed protein product [Polarella glacialis]